MEENLMMNSPITVIKSLLNKDLTMLHRLNEVGSYFLESIGDLSKIPCINEVSLENIAPNSLVRYRGMIQDMFDPEFYLGRYKITNRATKENLFRFGCYTDDTRCENEDEAIIFDSSDNVTLERQVYYCVPVPGESKWLKKVFLSDSAKHINSPQHISGKKRAHDNQEDNDAMETNSTSENRNTFPREEKQIKLDNALESQGNVLPTKKKDFDRNYPLPGENGLTCFVKVYFDVAEIKLNDIIEFVCIWSADSSDTATDDEMAGISEIEGCTFNPPPSQVPRLHCISLQKLTSLNPHICIKSSFYENTLREISTIRNDLMQILTNVFGGDATVAEYLLIHLVARTYGKCGTMCIGKFSLNILNCKEKFPQQIYKIIEDIVEKSFFLPLTVENLNKLKFTPRKDYETNKVMSGILQLPPHTNLVLDETQMQPGKLEVEGVSNMKALGNLIQWQTVEYDFKFSQVEMNTNVNVLVLSEGRSMLKCDCLIPIAAEGLDNQDLDSSIEKFNKSVEKFRIYLSVVQTLDYNLSEEASKALQDDFVEMRKVDSKAVNADTFYFLLSTARNMALSYGQTTLSASLWTRTKELDSERRKRST